MARNLPAKDWASSVRIPPSQQDSSRQLTGWRVEFPDEHKKSFGYEHTAHSLGRGGGWGIIG
jgi:hypothetical protein